MTTTSRSRSRARPRSRARSIASIAASSARSPAWSAATSSPGSTARGIPGLPRLYGEATVTVPTRHSLAAPAAPATCPQGRRRRVVSRDRARSPSTRSCSTTALGSWRAADYLGIAAAPRVAIGEQVTLGRLAAAAIIDWQPHPLVHVVGLAIANVRDPSALASVSVAYSVAANASALARRLRPGRTPADARGRDQRVSACIPTSGSSSSRSCCSSKQATRAAR